MLFFSIKKEENGKINKQLSVLFLSLDLRNRLCKYNFLSLPKRKLTI